jgi:hypothetical protein
VVAEKFEAILSLGIATSRMKDFYDLWTLASKFDFHGAVLGRAIRATLQRRGTAIPTELPLAFTPEFSGHPAKAAQWRGFLDRGRLVTKPPPLDVVIGELADFLWPVTAALGTGGRFTRKWPAGGPWR